MTIAVVQSNDLNGSGASLSFGSGVTTGNTVFLVVVGYSSSSSALSVTSPTLGGSSVTGSSTLQSEQLYYSSTGHNVGHFTFMLPDCPGGSAAVGWTAGGGTSIDAAFIYEVSGLGASPALDQQAVADGTTTAVASGTTPAITEAPEFILGAAAIYAGTVGGGTGNGPGSPPWTVLEPNFSGWAGYQIATSSGGTYSWSQTGVSADTWTCGIVTVYAGSGGTSPSAGNAAAAGTAQSPAPAVMPGAGLAAGTAAAPFTSSGSTVSLTLTAQNPVTATASALNAAVVTGVVGAGVAATAASAFNASVAVAPSYLYIGQEACTYLDYLDLATGHTLSPVPGNYYAMAVASGRNAALTVPPPGRPWNPGNPGAGGTFAPLEMRGAPLEDYAAGMARGRAHTSALHAAWARGDLRPGGPLSEDDHQRLGCCPA